MATLLPSLPSDDENEKVIVNEDEVEDDDDDDEMEMDKSFQFGGILGEDGGIMMNNDHYSSTAEGWSYQKALANIEKKEIVPRMNVDALIAAKRKDIQKQHQKEQEQKLQKNKKLQQQEKTSDRDSDDDDDDDDNNSEKSSSESDSDDDDTSDDEEEPSKVDDSHRHLEQDTLKTRAGKDEKESDDDNNNDNDNDDDDDDDESVSSNESDNDEDKKEAAKAAAFFESINPSDSNNDIQVFAQLTLSRPLLRGIAAMGFVKPTPIQANVIPLALQGRDICASAVTGSGKTAAFLLPILERMLHRYSGRIKAVVLTPTRELAAQCISMMHTFAKYTKLSSTLIVGGMKNLQSQAAELRARPDLVVATPGRLLDHVTNTTGVSLDDVEFLILDEADRLLDLGFTDEIMELVKSCPINRQTMLFSATMNTKVDDLIQLSLKNPIRVKITDNNNKNNMNKNIEIAPRLEQEFVRIRSGNEGIYRDAILLSLLTRTYTKHVIVFFDTKAIAHKMMIICGLCGIKCTELHGNLTQQQRIQALEDFRSGYVDILLATDLAARGLDIDTVQTVINYEMPSQIDTYIHRIGRTARAGRGGRSCTLIGEGRRHLMKEIIKDVESTTKKKNKKNLNNTNDSKNKGVIRSRSIPAAVITHFAAKIESLETHIDEVFQAEAVARLDRIAEMEAIKAQNIIEHADEIEKRPKREWFASNKDKQSTKEAALQKQKLIEEMAGTGTHRMTNKKRRAREAMKALQQQQQAEAEDDDNDDNDGGDKTNNKKATKKVPNMKLDARKQKRAQIEKEKENAAKSVHDYDIEAETLQKKQQKKKRSLAGDATGDGSLFNDEKISYAKKNNSKKSKTEEVASSSYHFHGYDPNKKLGKKKGNKKFKSKAKYRRR